MKILISKRKLTSIIYVMICILCGYAVYLVYLFHIQDTSLAYHSKKVQSFVLQDMHYIQHGEKRSQQFVDISNTHQKGRDGDNKPWNSLENGVQNSNNFIHEYLTSVPITKTKFSHNQAYMDTELSEKLMDIHDMDNVDVSSVDGLISHGKNTQETQRDFHYPAIGYRYYGAFKGSVDIPSYQYTHAQNSYTHNVSPLPSRESNVSNTSLASNNSSTKSKSNANTTRKIQKKKTFPLTAMPPSLVNIGKKLPGNKRYLVYLCDASSLCGGWGDRQRAMVSTYLLSRLIDREFKIIMTTPCNLRLFYKPNKVQWLPLSKELVSNSSISINAFMDKSFQLSIMEGDFNKKYPQQVLYLKTNHDYYDRLRKNDVYSNVLSQWGGLNLRRPRFNWGWNDLMQPSQMLMTHLKHIVGTEFLIRKGLIPNSVSNSKKVNARTGINNSTLICAHVRMGKNPTIPMDEYLKSFKLEYLPTLFNFMLSKDTDKNSKFFVATDYDHIRTESKKFFGPRVVDYGGKILHIDRQRSEHSACVGFEVALMDQLMLSLCDILVVCKSGFSINASYMSNSTGHVYFMKDGNIEKFNG